MYPLYLTKSISSTQKTDTHTGYVFPTSQIKKNKTKMSLRIYIKLELCQ